MPNYVTNKIIFPAEHAERVFAACCTDGNFDFEKIIPTPENMFRGHLSEEDRKANPVNWYDWCNSNWGTKWNAYDSSCKVEGDHAIISFDTAWSVPEPIIKAFAEKFLFPFELRYFDEGHNFWGITKYDVVTEMTVIQEKRESLEEDKISLCVELKGYNPETDE